MQVQRCAGQFLELARGKEVIEVSVSVDDAHQRQPMGQQASKDLVRVTARVDDDGLFGKRVADQGAVALQGAYREGFADE
ncbi:hypothetical protein D3C75_558990 [compost metagenome]